MKDNIPPHATCVKYQSCGSEGYSSGRHGMIFVWLVHHRGRPDTWYWGAQGQSGEESTQEAAIAAGRRWIRDGA